MPRFYFHFCLGDEFVEDEEGIDLPDLAAARSAAVASARDIMADEMRDGQLNPASFIKVEGEQNEHLFTLVFSEAYTVNLLN